jgi:HEAT repeat protein
MSNPKVLHRRLLYGASLNEGEEIFLIVRCLLESSEQRIAKDVRNQVVDALVWQLDSANVRQSTRRVRVARTLGQMRERTAIPYLVNVATKEVRINSEGWLTFDLTNVRMAAAIALKRMMPACEAQIRGADARLSSLLDLWCDQDVTALGEHLLSGDVVASAIAAAALADLQTEEAFQVLARAVYTKGLPADTGWALTDALALLDPALVTQEVIVPLIESRTSHWYERLAYLIGKTRTQDATAMAFLDRCLHELKRVKTKAKAIQSVGWLQDRTKTRLLEYVAMGRFDDIEKAAQQEVRGDDDDEDVALKQGFSLGKVTVEDRKFLRRKAIEALAHIGDVHTLTQLREGRVEWDAELRRAFFWTSEEIYWREQVRMRR